MTLTNTIASHPKIREAGALIGTDGAAKALAVFVASVGYARHFNTDGKIPATFATDSHLVADPDNVAKALSDRRVQLWHKTNGGGYVIHDFHAFNPSAEQVKNNRAKNARRKRAARASTKDRT